MDNALVVERGKVCTKCGSDGPFYRNRTTKDGLGKWCKRCDNENRKIGVKTNPESRKRIIAQNNARSVERKQAWRKAHRGQELKKARLWAKNNRGKANARLRNYRSKKRGGGGGHTDIEFKSLCEEYNNCCACCNGRLKLEADHVIPISKLGSSDISNIQPLCRSCNASKSDKSTDYRRITGERREQANDFCSPYFGI